MKLMAKSPRWPRVRVRIVLSLLVIWTQLYLAFVAMVSTVLFNMIPLVGLRRMALESAAAYMSTDGLLSTAIGVFAVLGVIGVVASLWIRPQVLRRYSPIILGLAATEFFLYMAFESLRFFDLYAVPARDGYKYGIPAYFPLVDEFYFSHSILMHPFYAPLIRLVRGGAPSAALVAYCGLCGGVVALALWLFRAGACRLLGRGEVREEGVPKKRTEQPLGKRHASRERVYFHWTIAATLALAQLAFVVVLVWGMQNVCDIANVFFQYEAYPTIATLDVAIYCFGVLLVVLPVLYLGTMRFDARRYVFWALWVAAAECFFALAMFALSYFAKFDVHSTHQGFAYATISDFIQDSVITARPFYSGLFALVSGGATADALLAYCALVGLMVAVLISLCRVCALELLSLSQTQSSSDPASRR